LKYRHIPVALLTLSATAADYTHYSSVQRILESDAPQLADESKWNVWAREHDRTIRARLEQGGLDSMVNLLLFGTSFTKQPRIRIENIAKATQSGILRARTLDLLQGIRSPGRNERLGFVRGLLSSKSLDPDTPDAGVFILQNLERVLRELREFGRRPDRFTVFHDRGVSLDTSILPSFGIEAALRDLKERGGLAPGGVRRAAVIGPGLDFTDWDSGYDFYPPQTLQPFALYQSLSRLGFLTSTTTITVFDISPRVLDHLKRARARARTGEDYVVQLPRDPASNWLPEVMEYWQGFGSPATPIKPPALLSALETRAARFQPEVVLTCDPADLNIVVQRDTTAQFDLIVGTNVLVYYEALEQALAVANIASMLKPGGVFLSNTEVPGGRRLGWTAVRYTPDAGDRVVWYGK